MKINLKQPKYVLPLILLPFLGLFFYVYSSSAGSNKTLVEKHGMKEEGAEISDQVRKKSLTDKLDAYRDRYRESDGYSAVNNISEENAAPGSMASMYSDQEKRSLDSISQVLKRGQAIAKVRSNIISPYVPQHSGQPPFNSERISEQDRALAAALSGMSNQKTAKAPNRSEPKAVKETDPMEVFRQQMSYMDSLGKVNDPAYQAEFRKKEAQKKEAENEAKVARFVVKKERLNVAETGNIISAQESGFIKAIIDEDITGFAGSRIRIRLLDDVIIGQVRLGRGNYLYAEVAGFSAQRIKLSVTSILAENKILPVRLEVYDLDGLQGLYVPQSTFREFSRNLGAESTQGFNTMGSAQNQQEFVMSAVDRIFQSTSSAISGLIRKNKAKIKYSTQLFLIDMQEQQNKLQK